MNRVLYFCIWFVIGLRIANCAENAFVTLLYGEDFLLGVRVLGQSIRASKTNADLVVIVTGELSEDSILTLKSDGWIVHEVEQIANPGRGPQPGRGFPPRFSSVYTKITIFRLIQYQKIVFLDADTLMLRNSDELFLCPGFCATLRHSERFNSGVMVVTPSEELYKDMMSKIHTLSSYTGGDQGFFNSYFKNFVNAPLYDPTSPPSGEDVKMMKLPTVYNADIGLYVLNSNRWMIPESQLKIIHYTLGPFKPWYWWASWIVKDLRVWQQYRYSLPADTNGNEHGVSTTQRFWMDIMTWIPVLSLGFIIFRFGRRWKTMNHGGSKKSESVPSTSAATFTHPMTSRMFIPDRFVGYSILIGFCTLLLSLGSVLLFLPTEIPVFWGWFIACEWTLFLHVLLFGSYLIHCFRLGSRIGMSLLPTFRFVSWSNPWKVTTKSVVAATVMIILCPWLADMILVRTFVGKVLVTSVGGLILSIYLTHVYGNLPIRWFMFGRTEFANKNGG
eukprot:g4966.t1